MMVEILYKDEVYAIIGAAIEVHRILGPGYLEAVYQEALEIELTERGIPFISLPALPIYYKERELKKSYQADFLIFDKIIVEIKAISSLTTNDEAQLLNELVITKHPVGLLINFGSFGKLEWKRRANTKKKNQGNENPRSNAKDREENIYNL